MTQTITPKRRRPTELHQDYTAKEKKRQPAYIPFFPASEDKLEHMPVWNADLLGTNYQYEQINPM